MCRAHPVALLVPGVVLFVAFGAPAAAFDTLSGDAAAADVALVLVAQGLGLATVFLYSGYCEAIAEQDRLGEEVSVRAALRSTAPTVPALIVASLVAGVGIVLGLVLLIVPGLWLMTRWVLVSPVISFERCGPWAGLRRSTQLSRGHGRLLLVIAVDHAAARRGALAWGRAARPVGGRRSHRRRRGRPRGRSASRWPVRRHRHRDRLRAPARDRATSFTAPGGHS